MTLIFGSLDGTLISNIQNILAPILLIVLGLISMDFLIQRKFTHFSIFLAISAVCAALFYMPFFVNNVATGISGAEGVSETESKNGPPAAPAEPVQVIPGQNAPVDVPWGILGFILVVLVVVATLIWASVYVGRKLLSSRNQTSLNVAGWTKLMGEHDSIRKQWASYELDLAKIIDLPLMHDMREPATVALHSALKLAKSLEPESASKMAGLPFNESPYAKAVHNLDIAFTRAQQEAKRVAWSRFTPAERKSLNLAKGLLALAMDTSAATSERQIAYKRVIKELQGLVVIPDAAILELEASRSLALTA